MLKIILVEAIPDSSSYRVAFTGEQLPEQVFHSAQLRCAGYRFAVDEVVSFHYDGPVHSVIATVLGEDAPQVGMVVHPADEPLTDEELAAAVQHLLMVPRLLKALDATGVLKRLANVPEVESADVRFAAAIVENMALQVSRLVLPTDNGLQEAERYRAELLRAC